MSKSLVIVESPAKARTIRKYLGSSYTVKASLGHVKDLPKSKMGVAVDKSFRPEYRVIPGKRKILNELIKSAKICDHIYLALDPDREGEAIAWHIFEELGDVDGKIQRVLFNEITRKGITEGLADPHPINLKRFESQQARRILDRLVGYEISPILWKKVRRGLSAGRVQSVALRMVVDREAEINAFDPQEYWKLGVSLKAGQPPVFAARYHGKDGKKLAVNDEATAMAIKSDLSSAVYTVSRVDKKERRRAAPPPFITSRLQQEMARRYRFTAKRTMMIAQQLYEGVDIGDEGTVGLITYMRTDSVRLADDAVNEVRTFIREKYGSTYVPAKPNVFKSKKAAQDAHEAIRPTSVTYQPDKVGKFLSRDQQKLYQVVWERFVACQMKPAVFDQTVVRIQAAGHELRASGSVMKFSGWQEIVADIKELASNAKSNGDDDDTSTELPLMKEGDTLQLAEGGVSAEQKFTQPPARFTEGTLIRELEERGIGRPSTYATIMSTIIDRRYVRKEDGRLSPTELGFIVTDRLVQHFPRILDVDFTASMEESLDKVEEGKQDWVALLTEFYKPFQSEVRTALKNMKDVRELTKETDKVCEKCGAKMVEKWGRNGRFLACSAYPECRNTMEVDEKNRAGGSELEIVISCELCGKEMIRKRGRFGDFLACSGYPDCKATRSMPTGIDCPREGCKGELVERRTKRGRMFYGCSEFNKTGCNFVVWGVPVKQECPLCHASFLLGSNRRNGGRNLKCVTEGCAFQKVESETA